MKKTLGLKAGILGVAILAAGAFATVPAILPQTAYAAEKSNSSSATDKMYTIARKINLIFQENGKTTDIKTLVQKGYVSAKNMAYTFPKTTVADLLGGKLGAWVPSAFTIPSVSATYDRQPEDVNITLTIDKAKQKKETKTITRTINYFNVENGKKTKTGSKTDSVTFIRYGYLDLNGKIIMGTWSGNHTFKAVTVPAKSGYTQNIKTVPAKTVTPTDSDFTVEVIYTKKSSYAKNGWKNENGGWKYYKNNKAYTGWHYMTKAEGENTDHWSYFGDDGKVYTGWKWMTKKEGEKTAHWSYFGPNGWLRTNWQQMGKGTSNPDGNNPKHWSYFGPNGWLRTGLQEMGKGTKNPDGNNPKHKSYFGNNGWLVTNKKINVNGKTYTADGRGWLK